MYYKDNVTRKVDPLKVVKSFKKLEESQDENKTMPSTRYGTNIETHGKNVPSITDSPVKKNPKPFDERSLDPRRSMKSLNSSR